MKKIEILAPAGSPETLHAAINAGADAVYMGGDRFSARAYATNFSIDDLETSIDYCHLQGVKAYIAINTLIKDTETEDFFQYVLKLYEIGADALIIQDVGMLSVLGNLLEKIPIHGSTQMTTNTVDDALFLKALGVDRIVVSRELGWEEIKKIKEGSQLEIETFVHGALCVAYSGKCLFSAMNGGRSGNRGACAQPCRESYQISNLQEKNFLDGSYVLSPRDLNTIEHLSEVMKSGTDSLKIEGRMKNKEYVFLTTQSYRTGISILQNNEINLLDRAKTFEEMNSKLDLVFNRSYTNGYISKESGKSIMNPVYQKPQGEKVGKVISFDKKSRRLKIHAFETIVKGDGLSTGEKVGRILMNNEIVDQVQPGEIFELDYLYDIMPETIIYRTYNQKFQKEMDQQISQIKKTGIEIYGEFIIDNLPLVRVVCGPHIIEVFGEEPIVKSLKTATTKERIEEQLQKLGDYPFFSEKITLSVDQDIHLPIKVINELRRKAIEELSDKIIQSYKRNAQSITQKIINHSFQKPTKKNPIHNDAIRISAKISNIEQINGFDKRLFRVYVDNFSLAKEIETKFPHLEIVYAIPQVIKENDIQDLYPRIEKMSYPLMTSSMGVVHQFKDKVKIVDYQGNLYNSYSHNFFHNMGFETTMSLETIYAERDELLYIEDKTRIEIPIYLYPVLMTSEYCPYKNSKGVCIHNYQCKLPETTMTNSKGQIFSFKKSINCKSIIFNSDPKKMSSGQLADFLKSGYSQFRIELIQETPSQIDALLKTFKI